MKIIINGEVVEVGGGGGSEDVYSTEETIIGTWIDGKPLYRITALVTIPGSWEKILDIPTIEYMVCAKFVTIEPISGGYYSQYPNNESNMAFKPSDGIWAIGTNSDTRNKSGYLTVEYTKTTDESTTS